jgi:hypothetical protein
MDQLTEKRVKFAACGFVYGLALTTWSILISGGGHFNLPIVLFISPVWAGLLLWPLWGYLAARFDFPAGKVIFLCTMAAHYAGIAFYVLAPNNNDGYWFGIGMNDPTFILFPASAIGPYLAGQLFLWVRFLRDGFGRRNLTTA